jgi:ubiquinone/menaquinone biosynthesis C-methylase UbiE
MPLVRVLEPEVMDSEEEAREYDAIDHGVVNARFCEDLMRHAPDLRCTLDVGAGTALIPIELCRRASAARVLAIDLAESMLRLGARNVERAALSGVITLALIDAKRLGGDAKPFKAVVSNSIIHHIPAPRDALAEMARVLAPGGLLFVRDLLRPDSDIDVRALVETYAREESPRQRGLFEASLRAALSLEEVRDVCDELGIPRASAQQTSDRHFTLAFHRPAA